MIYAYRCTKCKHKFDVTKSYREMETNEFCPRDGSPAERQFMPEKVHLIGANTVFNAEFNPGLGCVVKSERHKKEILKKRGLVEIGNDYGSGEKQLQEGDKAREEKQKREWEAI